MTLLLFGELKGKEANTFFDAISTGHTGYATLHTDSTDSILDRLVVLIKKDIRAQGYSESFLKTFLARTIDYVVYMKDYKVNDIAEISIDNNERIVMNRKFLLKEVDKDTVKKLNLEKEDIKYLARII